MDAPDIPATDEELLAQCDVDTFRASGKGGQSVNTADSAVRLRHRPTGVTVTCRRERSQLLNKRDCLGRLRRKLEALAYEPPERVPTKEPARVKEAVLETKARTSAKKRMRRKPSAEEE
ncbi:MAG TPA: peptide chain release factor-like protein [Coriobacteriia bacterium]|jgi:protein subunit release factor B